MGLLVLVGQHFEDARVAPDGLVRALGHQVDDARRPLLPVAVHPAVALLEDHQRPRQVEVDEPVALVVQVDPLRRHVGADQQAQRARPVAEVFDHPLLVHVAQAAVERPDLLGAEPQVFGEPCAQPFQRFDPLGEDDQPVRRVVRAPVERPAAADGGEQRLVLRVVAGAGRGERAAQDAQRRDFRRHLRVGLRRRFRRFARPAGSAAARLPFPPAEALVDAREAGGGAGEERLLQGDEEQVASRRRGRPGRPGRGNRGDGRRGLRGRPGRPGGLRRAASASRHPHREQRLVGRFFRGRGGEAAPDDLPVAEGVAHLVPDVLLEAPDDQPLAAEVVLRVVVRVGDGGRVEHVHQAREAARPAVVRRRREHDERVGAAGEQPGEAAAQRGPPVRGPRRAAGAPVGDVVRLVDDDDVPVRLLQVRAVLGVLLQGVDGDDRLVVVVERVVAGRDATPHPLDADRVEPHEGDREAVPELLLELREHAPDGQHQDAPPPPAGDQLGGQDARLERLAEPHRVGDQDALPRLAQRLAGRLELVGGRVHRGPVGDVDALVVGDRLPELALQVEPAVGEAGRRIGHEPGRGRVEHLDVRLQGGEEDRLAPADQLRDAVAHQPPAAVRRAVYAADHPLGVADHDAGAGGERRARTAAGRVTSRIRDRTHRFGFGPCRRRASRFGFSGPYRRRASDEAQRPRHRHRPSVRLPGPCRRRAGSLTAAGRRRRTRPARPGLPGGDPLVSRRRARRNIVTRRRAEQAASSRMRGTSPWRNPASHRDGRGARLTRREEGVDARLTNPILGIILGLSVGRERSSHCP